MLLPSLRSHRRLYYSQRSTEDIASKWQICQGNEIRDRWVLEGYKTGASNGKYKVALYEAAAEDVSEAAASYKAILNTRDRERCPIVTNVILKISLKLN